MNKKDNKSKTIINRYPEEVKKKQKRISCNLNVCI